MNRREPGPSTPSCARGTVADSFCQFTTLPHCIRIVSVLLLLDVFGAGFELHILVLGLGFVVFKFDALGCSSLSVSVVLDAALWIL